MKKVDHLFNIYHHDDHKIGPLDQRSMELKFQLATDEEIKIYNKLDKMNRFDL